MNKNVVGGAVVRRGLSVSSIALLVATVVATPAFAAKSEAKRSKPDRTRAESSSGEIINQFGAGSYAVAVAGQVAGDNAEFSGTVFWFQHAFNESGVFRGGYYSTAETVYSEIKNSGFDLQILYGKNMVDEGFKYYGGAGYFSETWEDSTASVDFSGFQLSGGIGYNWERFAIDYFINLRDSSPYKDFYAGFDGASSGSLSISYRY